MEIAWRGEVNVWPVLTGRTAFLGDLTKGDLESGANIKHRLREDETMSKMLIRLLVLLFESLKHDIFFGF